MTDISKGNGIEVSDACPALFAALSAAASRSAPLAIVTDPSAYVPMRAPRRVPKRPVLAPVARVVTDGERAGLL
jgi:hypothetical protein